MTSTDPPAGGSSQTQGFHLVLTYGTCLTCESKQNKWEASMSPSEICGSTWSAMKRADVESRKSYVRLAHA